MNESLNLIATTAFGLEAVVSRELKALGYTDQTVEDGRVRFVGDARAVVRCNLWLRKFMDLTPRRDARLLLI